MDISPINIIAIIAIMYVALNFVLKLIELRAKYNLKRDNHKVFLSHLYRQERYWSDKGEQDYAKAFRILIDRFSTEEEKEPETLEGKIAKKAFKNNDE